MKKVKNALWVLLIMTCLNTYAQNVINTVNNDSIKMEILKLMNNGNFEFWFYDEIESTPPHKLYHPKVVEEINIISNTIYFKTNAGFVVYESIKKVNFSGGTVRISFINEVINENKNDNSIDLGSYAASVRKKSFKKRKPIEINKQNDDFDKLFYLLKLYQKSVQTKFYKDELEKFKSVSEKYKVLIEKPIITEEQRKYIVQANSFNEQKMYDKAIKLYIKAIKLDQTAYPAAYSNLALLYAQLNKFDAAIYNMKKYLMLESDAEDARSCQDKIYEWEAQITK